MVCVLASCSDGGSEDPVNPTPKPEEVKTEITIDSSIISNGLSFGVAGSEQSISFSVNADWTLSVASTSSGATWCKASATSGNKGTANVKFTVDENTGYDDRSVSVTIKAGSVSKTFTITQKGADALLVTTNRYEVAQEGGQIEIEVKANIDYQMEISETAKSWITEASSRALTTYKHTFDIALNEDAEKREGEITFKSGDKVETVKVYQAGGALILLSQNEYTVSDAGETISVDIKSNVEYSVQMPDVDWITDEASSRGMSSHTLKYVIAPNEGYDSRSAEIIFYDKNSDLKETLKVVQAQKDAIVISEKNFNVSREGGTIEVKVNTNVDFEVQIPSDVTWVSQTDSRALSRKSIYLKIAENKGDDAREVEIVFVNKESQISESITISQAGAVKAGYENGVVTIATAGTMKKLLGDDYLNITSLKVVGPINGDDVYYLRKMLGSTSFSAADWGKLTTLDLSEATIVEGGGWYLENKYTSNNAFGHYMFNGCSNLQNLYIPSNIKSIGKSCFSGCINLKRIYITDLVAWCKVDIADWVSAPFSDVDTKNTNLYLNNVLITELVIPKEVTEVKSYSFIDCENIVKVIVHDNVNIIGDYAFWGCNSLSSVIIGNNVTQIGEYAFAGCKLNSVTMGTGINRIKTAAFIGNDFNSIVITDNVILIDSEAFADCYNLNKISIGKNVRTIGDKAFENASITECYCFSNTPPSICVGSDIERTTGTFYKAIKDKKKAKLYVPARTGTSYRASKWGRYFENIVEMD